VCGVLGCGRGRRYPRTDCFGSGLLGTILSALGGLLIFFRLVAVIRGA